MIRRTRVYRPTDKLLAAIEGSERKKYQIALAAGWSPSDLSRLLRGYWTSADPKLAKLLPLARVLRIPLAECVVEQQDLSSV